MEVKVRDDGTLVVLETGADPKNPSKPVEMMEAGNLDGLCTENHWTQDQAMEWAKTAYNQVSGQDLTALRQAAKDGLDVSNMDFISQEKLDSLVQDMEAYGLQTNPAFSYAYEKLLNHGFKENLNTMKEMETTTEEDEKLIEEFADELVKDIFSGRFGLTDHGFGFFNDEEFEEGQDDFKDDDDFDEEESFGTLLNEDGSLDEKQFLCELNDLDSKEEVDELIQNGIPFHAGMLFVKSVLKSIGFDEMLAHAAKQAGLDGYVDGAFDTLLSWTIFGFMKNASYGAYSQKNGAESQPFHAMESMESFVVDDGSMDVGYAKYMLEALQALADDIEPLKTKLFDACNKTIEYRTEPSITFQSFHYGTTLTEKMFVKGKPFIQCDDPDNLFAAEYQIGLFLDHQNIPMRYDIQRRPVGDGPYMEMENLNAITRSHLVRQIHFTDLKEMAPEAMVKEQNSDFYRLICWIQRRFGQLLEMTDTPKSILSGKEWLEVSIFVSYLTLLVVSILSEIIKRIRREDMFVDLDPFKSHADQSGLDPCLFADEDWDDATSLKADQQMDGSEAAWADPAYVGYGKDGQAYDDDDEQDDEEMDTDWEFTYDYALFNQRTAALLDSIQYADLLEIPAYYALTEPNELVEILSYDFDFPFSEAYLDGIDVEKCITAVDQKRMIPRIGKKIKKPKPKSNKKSGNNKKKKRR